MEEQFIFEADIKANIDVKTAQDAIDKLERTAKQAGENIREGFAKAVDSLKDLDKAARTVNQTMQWASRKTRDELEAISNITKNTSSDFNRLNDDISEGFKRTASTIRTVFSGSLRDMWNQFKETLAGSTMDAKLRDAVRRQGVALRAALAAESPKVREEQRRIAEGLVQEIDTMRSKMAAAGVGINQSLADGLKSVSENIGSGQWDAAREYAAANDDMAKSFETLVGTIESHAERLQYTMRELVPSWSESLSGLRRSMELIGSESVGFAEGIAIGTSHVADLGKSVGFLSDESVEFVRKIGAVTERIGSFFGGIKKRVVDVDKSMLQISNRIEDVSVNLKTQQQVLTRLFQTEEANLKRRIVLSQRQIQAMDEILEKAKGQDTLNNDITNALVDIGVRGVRSYKDLQVAIGRTNEETERLEDRQMSMSIIFRKNLSQLATQFNRLESNAMHFGTTLENSGRVAGERIRDMSYNLAVARKMMKRATETGLRDIPELAEWFD